MSCDVKAVGTLTFDELEDIEDAMADLDDDDPALAEVRALVEQGTTRRRKRLTIAIVGHLTAEANLWLQEWLGDLAEAAIEGHVDTWQEDMGDRLHVRVHAGGQEEPIEGPFPAP